MAKLKTLATKLQMALTQKGRYITINQTQIYSKDLGRMCTKYILREKRRILGKERNVTVLETFRIVDVLTFLADTLNGGE